MYIKMLSIRRNLMSEVKFNRGISKPRNTRPVSRPYYSHGNFDRFPRDCAETAVAISPRYDYTVTTLHWPMPEVYSIPKHTKELPRFDVAL